MKTEEREIQALLQLIDDPDQEVFDRVADKILDYGSGIIPQLETLWEESPDELLQHRIELLIHKVQFHILREDFIQWDRAEKPDLLAGAILVARYQYPGLVREDILSEIKKIERNIWLELNEYLTPLEKINVLNSMIYSYFHMRGTEMAYDRPDRFFINKIIQSKKGNALSIGVLYQVLCRRLKIPIYAIGLPRQFILGYFDASLPLADGFTDMEELKSSIPFYIDPMNGQIYIGEDVMIYLKSLKLPLQKSYFVPQSAKNIIRLFLEELSLCYKGGADHFRYEELKELSDLLSD